MTEAEWLACEDPQAMVGFVQQNSSNRKKRLFVVACARHVWDQLVEPEWRTLVELAERVADEDEPMATLTERSTSLYLQFAAGGFSRLSVEVGAWGVAMCAGYRRLDLLTSMAAWSHANRFLGPYQAVPLRDIFGNPFRPVTLDPAWLTPTVSQLAQAAYEERLLPSGHLAPERLAVLADALEEAGAVGDLLEHLRGPGPHVRGCFVIDTILAKS